MIKGRKYILTKYFVGEPKPSDLTLENIELPPLRNGEILVEAKYLSVDPYMQLYSANFPRRITMIGGQVAEIIESRNRKYPVGKHIFGYFGWTTHRILNPDTVGFDILKNKPYILPDFGGLPISLSLGMLGMPGNAAYFGLLEICKPKAGETLVVSGAAGAVGSHVGQIGKILGLTVVGIAGSDEKCKWLVDELKFDHAINYKSRDLFDALHDVVPNGVDCYFDNVGGDISSAVIYLMKKGGRISICGCISTYNLKVMPITTVVQPVMVYQELKMEGFIVSRWVDRWMEGIHKNMAWIRAGKLRYRETITEGFENMFEAFTGMLNGKNFGKAIVKV